MSTSEQQMSSSGDQSVTRRDPLADEPGADQRGGDRYDDRPGGEPEFAEPGRSGPVAEDPMLTSRDDTDRYDPTRDDQSAGDTVREDTVRGDTVRDDTVRDDTVRSDPAGEAGRSERPPVGAGEPADYPAARETSAVDAGGAGGGAPAMTEPRDPGVDGGADTDANRGTAASDGGLGGGAAPASSTAADDDDRAPLVASDRAEAYATRWNEVKGMFVDEPRQAVQQADGLVGELLDELQQVFSEQRRGIEHGLDTDDTSTEDLRTALRRYRSFFDRLLSV
jgi:hypothetical protein